MVASYPDTPRAFTPRVDRVDINAAQDINDLQDEVMAVEQVLGRNPHTSPNFPAPTLSERLALFEANVLPRVQTLEQRLRRAAVTANRAAAVQYASSPNWQPLVLPDTVSTLNDYGTALQLYDGSVGQFYSVAPSPGIWSFHAIVTWEATANPIGVRGLQLVTRAGTVLSMREQVALANEPQVLSLNWTGRLPIDPAFYLSLMVKQTQGTALNLLGDTSVTPLRADFTHIPG